jgi:hypothetical protein
VLSRRIFRSNSYRGDADTHSLFSSLSLESLPRELLVKVIDSLRIACLSSFHVCKEVCTDWRAICRDLCNKVVIVLDESPPPVNAKERRVDLDMFTRRVILPESKLVKSIRSHTNLRHISCTVLTKEWDTVHHTEFWRQVVPSHPWEHLEFRFIGPRWPIHVAQNLHRLLDISKLKVLIIHDRDALHDKTLDILAVLKAPKLERLELMGWGFDSRLLMLELLPIPTLRWLDIDSRKFWYSESIEQLRKMPALEHFGLTGKCNILDESYDWRVLRTLPRLNSLALSGTHARLQLLAESCTGLRTVTIRNDWNNLGAGRFLETCENLECFDVSIDRLPLDSLTSTTLKHLSLSTGMFCVMHAKSFDLTLEAISALKNLETILILNP